MARVVDKSGNVVAGHEHASAYGAVIELLDERDDGYEIWESLSDLVSTMTGDASTPFNTVGEMIKVIPAIVNCHEEQAIILVLGNRGEGDRWYVSNYCKEYEFDCDLWQKILQDKFPELTLVKDEMD